MQDEFVFGYLRLSNDDDDRKDESNSIVNQRLLIQQYIQSREEFHGACVQFCVDDGYSGTNYDRPGFQKMMEMVKSRTCCTIICKDLSRIGRDTVDTQNYIEKVFPFLQVRFIAINDSYDSNEPITSRKDSEAKFKNLVNGIYPQICSQNIKQVMKKQAEDGKYHGSIPPFGYQFNGNDKTSLLVDEEAAKVVRLIFEERLDGKGYSEIARLLNDRNIATPTEYLKNKGFAVYNYKSVSVWTSVIVERILTNMVYTGVVVNHKTENKIVATKSAARIPKEEWICIPDMHQAIISVEELDKVLSMRKHRVHYATEKIPRNIFRGKIKCGYCKKSLIARTGVKIKNMRAKCTTTRYDNKALCYKKGFNLSDIEKLVLDLVKQQAAIADNALRKIRELNKTLDTPKLKKKIQYYEEKSEQCALKKRKLYEQYVSGETSKERFLDEKEKISQKSTGYQEKIDALQEKIHQAQNRKAKENSEALLNFAKYTQLEDLSYQIVQELVDVIYFYDPEHIEVFWNFRDEYMEIMNELGEMNVG